MALQRPDWITFDCYDTLVDFTLNQMTLDFLGERTTGVDTDAFLRTFSDYRKEEESTPDYQPYRDVLRNSLRRAMAAYGMTWQESDGAAGVAAVRTFGPHPDVPPALERLRKGCHLAVITNSDDDIIVDNVRLIGVPFEHVITAQQAQAYKPSHAIFEVLFAKIGTTPDRILHLAQDFERDMVPAGELGIGQRAWINRYHLAGHPENPPDVELPSLTGLPELLGL